MKLFLCFLVLVPFISFGFIDERRSFGGDGKGEGERRFLEESISYFSEGFNLLIYLAENDYAPAQKILGLMNQDFKEAKNFLKDYNEKELKPVLPPTGHSRSFWQRVRDAWVDDISAAVEEAKTFELSVHFSHALEQLTKGFHLLDILKKRNYEPAKEFQSNFEARIAGVMEKSGVPVYVLSSALSKRCEFIFSNYYTSAKQKFH